MTIPDKLTSQAFDTNILWLFNQENLRIMAQTCTKHVKDEKCCFCGTIGRRLTAVMSRRSLEVSGHRCSTLRFPGCHQVCPFGRWKWRLCLHVPWRSSMWIPIIHAGRLKWLVGLVHGIVFAIVCQLHQITVYPHYSIISIFLLMKLKFLGMNILDS